MTKLQKFFIALTLFAMTYMLYTIANYWRADILYAKGKYLNKSSDFISAQNVLTRAIKISPNEPYYHLELSESYLNLDFPEKAILKSQKAIELSPANVNLKRALFSTYIRLSTDDPKYLINAVATLEEAIKMAPTDAKLYYNLGLAYVRIGQIDRAIEILRKTIEMKPNYNEAKLALEYLLNDIIAK
ncbi:MAG: tetratricopeptide repeat protein [Patescibacteria group bacterium]